MIRKLAALLLVFLGFAVSEYLVFQRSMDPAYARIIVPDLLPLALGEFRVVNQWRREATSLHPLEVGASYRDSGGVEATLDFMLGARMPHNGIACWLVRGYPLLGENLRRVRIGNHDAVFDTAFFQESDGMTLVANTECYAEGCVEDRIPEPRRLRLPFFANPTRVDVPVSILMRERSASPGENSEILKARLIEDLARFSSGVDLGPLFVGKGLERTSASAEAKFR